MADQDEPNTEQTADSDVEPGSGADVAADDDVVEAHVWRAQS